MQNRSYFQERLSRLGFGEALNVTFTTPDGNEIRKVKFNPRTARSLVEIPNNKGFVFNLSQGFEGLDNFLRLKGYDRERIQKIHQQLGKKEVRSPRRGKEDRFEDSVYQNYKKIAMKNLDNLNKMLKTAQSSTLSPDQRSSLSSILKEIPVDYTKIGTSLGSYLYPSADSNFLKKFLSGKIRILPNILQSFFPDLFSLMDEYKNLDLTPEQRNSFSYKLDKDPDYFKLLNENKKLAKLFL